LIFLLLNRLLCEQSCEKLNASSKAKKPKETYVPIKKAGFWMINNKPYKIETNEKYNKNLRAFLIKNILEFRISSSSTLL
jgi:hypothetical protein